MPRLPSGVEGFDSMVQGGLPVGSSVVLQGPPGQEKLRFALAFIAEGLRAGASGLVVTSSQSPDAILSELRGLGVNLDLVSKENRLRIVDWYSWSEEAVRDIEEHGAVLRSSIDLTNLGVALSRAITALAGDQPRRAVIELLSPATNVYDLSQVYAFAQSAKKKFDRYRFTSLVLLEKEMHSAAEVTTLHQPFDGVIEIERTRSGDRIVRKVGILHLKDTTADPSFRVLEFSDRGLRIVQEDTKPRALRPSFPVAALESQEERARRLALIMQIATERLKLNPRDTDALFALAAAQATLDDAGGGLRSLDRLAELDPNYPGLWVLKTKLHARLGEADRARQSRLRAQQEESVPSTTAETTVPCPMCDSPVSVDATMCGDCGVKFTPARKLEDELEDLGHAAIQQMVEEDFKERIAPDVPKEPVEPSRPRRKLKLPFTSKGEPTVPPESAPKPTPKEAPKKGLTNGLVLARGSGRRTGMTNGLRGRTNGLRGRANGLTNGLRGRTNGVTNGLGRTNGLTNGVGRTNGLTNGLGRTNGLTNGLGRTNGLTNGLGRTNGITNGLGRTNGLTNGLGGLRPAGFRSGGFRGMMRTAGWKLYVIPMVVVGLLLMPLFFVPEYTGPSTPIRIDGQFGDWTTVTTAAMGSAPPLDPNIDIVRFGVVDNLGPQAFYVQVAGIALQGGGASPGTMDSVRIFVDTDGLASTGYRIDGLGADRLIEVSGYAGLVRQSTLWEFDSNRDVRDWGGWIKGTATPAAASGSQIEAEAEWLAGSSSRPFAAIVHAASWDGQADVGDFPIGPSGASLSIVADPLVPTVIASNDVPLLRLTFTGHGQLVSLNSLTVQIVGTAAPTAAQSVRLIDAGSVLDEVVPLSRDVTFMFPAIAIGEGSVVTLSLVGDFSATNGDTFGLRLPSMHPFGTGAPAVGLRENAGTRMVGYLGSIPNSAAVDGGFDEWTALQTDASGDVVPRANSNIDLARSAAQSAGGTTYLYADVTGRILQGTAVPEAPKPTPVQGPPAPADTDRDSVPDAIDPMPLDFNNDGIADADTNGDYDGDMIVDYGFVGGTDTWLNTTLPGTFPAPYAGRFVSVYIGPTERPPALGEDAFRLFLDLDNSTASGYLISGIGADRLVELRGKDGQVTQSALLAFSGSFPGEWSWNPVAPVTVAVAYQAFELSVPLTVANDYVEASDFWGSSDSTSAAAALGPSFMSFKVSPASAPMSVPWVQVGPQPSGTLIDGGSDSVTTVYNHQRKVVRAGDVAGDTACDSTNSDGCWYAVFYDRSTASATEGPNYAGAVGTNSFTNPSNAVGSDEATCASRYATSHNGFWNSFGFAIPSDAIIDGIQVEIRHSRFSDPPGTSWRINTGKSETQLGTEKTVSEPNNAACGTSQTIASFGGTADLWGLTWTPVDLNSASFTVRLRNGGGVESGWNVNWIRVTVSYTANWDRVVMMRSMDTTGSTWGSQTILASGNSGDSPLLHSFDSSEPSIAIDSGGFLHVTWVSASAGGDQSTFDRVRYTRTTVSYPTQSELASAANWETVTNVDDASPGFMPTVSTDTSNNPHIAWSSSRGATEAGIAYRSNSGTNTVSSPKTRSWDGATWGAGAEEATAGSPVRFVRMAWSPKTPDERIIVTLSDDGWLTAYVCTPSCSVRNGIGQVWSTDPGTAAIPFDIAYESTSGDALLVYGVLSTDTTRDFAYRTYVGGTWSAEQYVNDATETADITYTAIKLASRQGNDQIGFVGAHPTPTIQGNAMIWSGTAFGNFQEIDNSIDGATQEEIAIAWESSSGHLVAVAIDGGVPRVSYREFTTAWSAYAQSIDCGSGAASWVVLKPNPLSTANDMILAMGDNRPGLGTCYWDGATFVNGQTHDAAIDVSDTRPFDFAWEATGSKGLLVYGTTAGQITRRTFTAPNTWGAATSVAMGTNAHAWVQLRTNSFPSTGDAKILGAVMEATALDLGTIRWDGTTFTVVAADTFTGDSGSTTWESFELDYHTYARNVYSKNKAAGTWRATVSWGSTYTGLSVDVSPQNNYVSLARYFGAATNEVQYTVCKDLATSNCDAAAEFTKFDGTTGYDTVATGVESGSYPSLATTYEANGDLWVAYADGQYALPESDISTGGWTTTPLWQRLDEFSADDSTTEIQKAFYGLVAYGEGTVTTPRYREYDGTNFLSEASAQTANAVSWVVVKASPTSSSDRIMGILTSTNTLYVQTWDGSTWTSNWNTNLGGSTTRRFDIAFEGSSGDAVVVFGDGTSQLKYRKRVGGTWDGSNQNAGSVVADQPLWVRAEPRPSTDDIFVAVTTNAVTLHAMRWAGSTNAWGDQTQMGTNVAETNVEGADIAFERTSGDAFVLWGTPSNTLRYREFTSAWQTEANAYTLPDKALWVMAAYDPISTSSNIAVGMVLNNGNFEWGAWNGSAWVGRPTAIAAREKTVRGMDVAFEKDSGKAVFIFDTSSNPARMSWRTWTSGGGFGVVTAETGTTGNIDGMQLVADPNGNAMIALYRDTNNDLFHRKWDGSSWSSLSTALETNLAGTAQSEAFMFAWSDGSATFEVKFSSVVDPQTSTGHVVKYRMKKSGSGTANVNAYLYQGTTLISSDTQRSLGTTYTTYTWTLSAGEAASITNYSDLRLRITTESGGDSFVSYATWGELEVPEVAGGVQRIYARFLDFPSAGWAAAEVVDALAGTTYTRPSIGIDKDNNVHALYVATSGPQVYYNKRSGGSWGTREAVGTSTDNPTLMVRSPNDATYGTSPGGLYWKDTTSETYFYIPEFESVVVPILSTFLILWAWRRRSRRREPAGSKQSIPNSLPQSGDASGS